MAELLSVAACQIDVSLGAVQDNCEKVLDYLSAAAKAGARLIVFPECALSGYCFESEKEACAAARNPDGPSLSRISDRCADLDVYCVLGFLEKSKNGLYNTAGVFGPDHFIRLYRKVHLPILGVDRFIQYGDLGFPVFDTPVGRIGLNICYDQRFPESARVLMLGGAQLVIVPTNEPDTDTSRDVGLLLTRARAFENRVFYMWVNRIGLERGTRFMGRSQIIDPEGNVVSLAGRESEEILHAALDLSLSEQKRIVVRPNEYEIDLLTHRRVGFYTKITEGAHSDFID